MIFCARATRGLRRPSLDARTMGNRQATPHDWTEGEKWWMRTIGIDRSSLKKENVPVFSSQSTRRNGGSDGSYSGEFWNISKNMALRIMTVSMCSLTSTDRQTSHRRCRT
jgi:hypothetical protein